MVERVYLIISLTTTRHQIGHPKVTNGRTSISHPCYVPNSLVGQNSSVRCFTLIHSTTFRGLSAQSDASSILKLEARFHWSSPSHFKSTHRNSIRCLHSQQFCHALKTCKSLTSSRFHNPSHQQHNQPNKSSPAQSCSRPILTQQPPRLKEGFLVGLLRNGRDL